MRLFSAVVPPPAVADHLAAALERVSGIAWVPRPGWHITLGYYGEDDLSRRAHWVRDRVSGVASARIALRGAGAFGRTVWAGVHDPDGGLAAIAAALRHDDRWDWQPHLTLGKGDPPALDYAGPEWAVDRIVLLGSASSREYTVLDEVELATP